MGSGVRVGDPKSVWRLAHCGGGGRNPERVRKKFTREGNITRTSGEEGEKKAKKKEKAILLQKNRKRSRKQGKDNRGTPFWEVEHLAA